MALRARVVGALPQRVAALFRPSGRPAPTPTAPAAPAAPHISPLTPGGELQTIHETRKAIATAFISGEGIEIGALHQPLPLPGSAKVKYVDRMTTADLRLHYPELATLPLVDTDIVDDGETLTTIPDGSQDFVVANHFLEHCQNPIQTLQNLFRVLKAGGVLFMAVPDKRFTFDVDRQPTTIDHLLRDYHEGPEWSKRQHFEDWSRLVNKQAEGRVREEAQHLINIGYSIHFHVWGASELLEFIAGLRGFIAFELELFLRNGPETIFVMRKQRVNPSLRA